MPRGSAIPPSRRVRAVGLPSRIELAIRQGATALTEDLERLIAALDAEAGAARDHIEAALVRLDELLALDWAAWPRVAESLDRVGVALRQAVDASAAASADAWATVRTQVGEAYDALVESLRADLTPPEPRPTNLTRSAFHVTSALVCLWFTLVVFTTAQLPFAAGAFAGTAWVLEFWRRRSPAFNAQAMRVFRRIARPNEAERINSGTWFMTALVVLASTYSPLLCVVSVAVLGFADPAAAIIGRRFGRIRLRHGRSLEGTLAFVAVGTVAAFGAMQLLPAPPAAGVAALIALSAAVAGAVAELVSRRIDDNLAIPLAALGGASLALACLDVSAW